MVAPLVVVPEVLDVLVAVSGVVVDGVVAGVVAVELVSLAIPVAGTINAIAPSSASSGLRVVLAFISVAEQVVEEQPAGFGAFGGGRVVGGAGG